MLSVRGILRTGAALCSFRRKLLFECDLDDLHPASATISVTFRFGGASDLMALSAPEFGYSPAAREFGLERLHAGDRFVVCESAGQVVYYAWVMFGQLDLSCRNYVPLSLSRAYTYKLFTVPAFRGKRICPAYYSFLKRELRGLGVRSVLAWVEAGNRASIHAHLRAGFQCVGTIWHFRLLARPFFIKPKSIAAPDTLAATGRAFPARG